MFLFRRTLHDARTFPDEDIEAYVRPFAKLGGVRGAAAHIRALRRSAVQNRKLAERKLLMPVLTVGAARTFGNTIEPAARQFAEDVSGVVAEHSGHWIPGEQLVWLSQQLVAFLSGKS
jgi:hypothetical protein